jgi:hypothetical protein
VPISVRHHYAKGGFIRAGGREDLGSPACAMRMKQFATWKGTVVRLGVITSCITGSGSPCEGGGLCDMGP